MSVKLKRIELNNIRSHKHVVFEPDDHGITAISGPNGAGKSTIADSVAWALYGTKPQGVSKAQEIFKNGIGEKDKASASIDLEVDDTLLRIVRKRVNKNGAVECEVSTVTVDDEGVETVKNVAGPAVSHAELYIKRHMKMDEKGFLAAILVQQKQVDQLISASPRERGAVIERLTGIASITTALTESKQEYNSLKKVASYSTVNETELKDFKIKKVELESNLSEKTQELARLKAKTTDVKAEGALIKNKLKEESDKVESFNNLSNKVTTLEARIEVKNEELDHVLKEKDKFKKKLSALSSSVKLDEIEPKINSLKSSLRKSQVETDSLERDIKSINNQLPELNEFINECFIKTIAEAKTILKESELEKIALIERKEKISEEYATLVGDNKKLGNAISVISQGDNCPTCLQKVSDTAIATQALENQKQSNNALIDSLKDEDSSVKKSIKEKIELIEEASTFIDYKDEIKRLKKELDEVTNERNTEIGNAKVIEGELSAIEKVYREAKNHEDTKNSYDNLLLRAKKISNLVEEHEDDLTSANNELKALGNVSSVALQKLQKKLDEARALYSSSAMKYSEINGEAKLLRQSITHLAQDITRHEEAITKYNELLKSVEVAGSTSELLAEFREERIKNSVPVIEIYASDLINRFTEGKFTALKLDQKFNATVILADGTPRAVGLLSGGELSVAAMSLRLAIAMLLNSGGGENLIILDEVLVSQDTNRAELILTTVKEVSKGQVILIAHNDAIDSIADKIITLDPA